MIHLVRTAAGRWLVRCTICNAVAYLTTEHAAQWLQLHRCNRQDIAA